MADLAGRQAGVGIAPFGAVYHCFWRTLVLLALVEAMVPPPLAYTVGETGFGGFVVLLIPIWSLWLARWFWQRELAGVGN